MRLTDAIRNSIRNRMIEHAFGERGKTLDADRLSLGLDVYRDIYDEKTRRKMARLPDGWLPTIDCLKVSFDGQFTSVSLGQERRIPDDDLHRCIKQYDGKHKFSKRHHELSQRFAQLREERIEARKTIDATLRSVTTLNRLHEVWPESRQFTKDLSAATSNLPAVPVKALNELLGLAA